MGVALVNDAAGTPVEDIVEKAKAAAALVSVKSI